jgi:hypothetical protein
MGVDDQPRGLVEQTAEGVLLGEERLEEAGIGHRARTSFWTIVGPLTLDRKLRAHNGIGSIAGDLLDDRVAAVAGRGA